MPRRVYTTLNERIEAFRRTDIYPVITSEFCAGRNPVEIAASLLEGGARILQIREKAKILQFFVFAKNLAEN